jgi:PLP dependent protein
MISYDDFAERAAKIRLGIDTACFNSGRKPEDVTLMAVTKSHPLDAALYAHKFGLKTVGENRVQEAIDKKTLCSAQITWELIGHLQSNKASLAARHFDRVQSVDSEKLLNHLNRAASELNKTLPILLQINAGRDPAKFGAEIEDAPKLLALALSKSNLRVDGLMTIAPLSEDPDVAKMTFDSLRTIRDKLENDFKKQLPTLSMGMSGDYAVAIAAGSTLIRVGSALFGERHA